MIVNRWAHGYPFFFGVNPTYPYEDGRKQLGNISFAGAEHGGDAWIQAAVETAIIAVKQQLKLK